MAALPLLLALGLAAPAPVSATLAIRGQEQELHLYGARGGPVAIVASGDGGWQHLGPTVAALLAARGYFVICFDSKHYLSGFTHGSTTLQVQDVPGDVAALLDYAGASPERPILVGVSEGAGLVVLAGAEAKVKERIGGVLALGMCRKCELGWRFKDQIIYITKGAPNEPLFDPADFLGRLAPVPLLVIHSTHDEFTPLGDAQAAMARAAAPSQLWSIEARDHAFDGSTDVLAQKLEEGLAWMRAQRR